MGRGRGYTAEALETFGGQAATASDVVGTQFMEDTSDGHRICEQTGDLSQLSLIVDGCVLSCIKVGIPVRHVGHDLLHLTVRPSVIGKGFAGVHVVFVFVGLAKGVTGLGVVFVVVHPMVFGTVDGKAAVGTFEVDMLWTLNGLACGFSGFRVVRGGGNAGWSVIWMWAEGVEFHEGSFSSDTGYGRTGEAVEEVVWAEPEFRLKLTLFWLQVGRNRLSGGERYIRILVDRPCSAGLECSLPTSLLYRQRCCLWLDRCIMSPVGDSQACAMSNITYSYLAIADSL